MRNKSFYVTVDEKQPPVSGYQPDWILLEEPNNNEILILDSNTGNRTRAIILTLAGSGNYITEIYDETNTIINTVTTASGVRCDYSIPATGGKICSIGYKTFKIRIRSENPVTPIINFCVNKYNNTEITYFGWLWIKFGVTTLTTINFLLASGCRLYMLAGVEIPNNPNCTLIKFECSDNQRLLNLQYIKIGDVSGVTSCQLTHINNLIFEIGNLDSLISGESMLNFYSSGGVVKSIKIGNMPLLKNVYNMFNYLGYLTLLEMGNVATLKNFNPYYNGLKRFKIGNCPDMPDLIGGASGIESIEIGNTVNLCNITIGNAKLLHTFTMGMCGIFQITCGQNVYQMLTEFDVPTARFAKLVFTGGSVGQRSLINYIDIDWTNSDYSGTSPQIDLRFNNLNVTELNRIFTALPSVSGKTISIIGNPGVSSCDTSIATIKGWSVTTA